MIAIRQYVNIFGDHTPWYGVCLCLSLLAIVVWILYGFKQHRLNDDRQNELLIGFPFVILLGVASAFVLDAAFTGNWRTWLAPGQKKFGFTYTGWLLGVSVGLFAHGRAISLGSLFLLNFYCPVLALTQCIGRIGCFLSGCCYGTPCAWGVKYPVGSYPFECVGDVALFPVQVVEALCLFWLFVTCMRIKFQNRAALYFSGVAIVRFILEMFRYDFRGSIFGQSLFSPQQIMSLLFMVFALALYGIQHNLSKTSSWRKSRMQL